LTAVLLQDCLTPMPYRAVLELAATGISGRV
jgi:hypothetical protein